MFLSIPITQKCQILSSDTLVVNERYVAVTRNTEQNRGDTGEQKCQGS